MNSDLVEREPGTVLVVADDSDMLVTLHQILTERGYRVLLASEVASAAGLLGLELGIDSVMIRAGLTDSERIELMCHRRDVGVLFFGGIVEAGIIRLGVPERRRDYAPRILIVDDEPAVRTLFRRSLAEDGYRVTAVETCGQALAAARKTTFDVLVVDLNLPDIDGIEAMRNFRSDFPWIKIQTLAVSEYTAGCVASAVLGAGATAVSGKPATSWELRKAVHGLLDPAGRWDGVALSRAGLRAVTPEEETLKMRGWESSCAVPVLTGFLM